MSNRAGGAASGTKADSVLRRLWKDRPPSLETVERTVLTHCMQFNRKSKDFAAVLLRCPSKHADPIV
jgi:hypothetical protein